MKTPIRLIPQAPLAAMFCSVGVTVGDGVPASELLWPAGTTVTDVIVLGLPFGRVVVYTTCEVMGAPSEDGAGVEDDFGAEEVDGVEEEAVLEVLWPVDVLGPELWEEELVRVKANGV
jgi:hypothetical protein